MYPAPAHDSAQRRPARPAPTLALIVGLLALAAGAWLGLRFTGPSPALPASADAALFSAERAWPLLERLVADGAPHPVGTAAGAAAMRRVVAEFEALGYEVELQNAIGCREQYAVCADVTNVLARLPGSGGGPALMLSAHHDSVGAGPGVSDDMAGVAAIIEVARMLREEPQLRNDVIFLITDGEEVGLTGAEAFLAHPWFGDVGLVANFEARGTSGQSLLFQTSPDNAWLIERFAEVAPLPTGSSLLYELYRLLPNDTDLSVYLEAGLAGVNFAFVENVQRYHTALDDLTHLSRDSFQHHGENALAAVRAFGDADLTAMPAGNALYLDALPGVMLRAPEGWAVWLALGALVLWLLIVMALIGAGAITPGGLLLALVMTLLGLLAAAALSFGVAELIKALSGVYAPWHAHPLPARAAVWAAGALGFVLLASFAARRAGFWGMAAAVWLWWTALALTAALLLPGASVVLLVPTIIGTLVFALLALFGAGLPARSGAPLGWPAVLLALVSVFAASYFMLPLAYFMELGLGFELPMALGLLAGLGVSGFAPLLAVPPGAAPARAALLLLGVLALAGAVVWSLNVPTFSAERPHRLNFAHAQLATQGEIGAAHWLVVLAGADYVPEQVLAAAPFGSNLVNVPGGMGSHQAAPAERLDVQPPTVEVLGQAAVEGGRALRLRLATPRGAEQLVLAVPRAADATLLEVPAAGRAIGYPRDASDRFDRFYCSGPACNGLELTLHVGAAAAFDVVVMDHSAGLPPGGEALLAARPATASPSGEGDVTSIFNTVRIGAAE